MTQDSTLPFFTCTLTTQFFSEVVIKVRLPALLQINGLLDDIVM